MRFNVLYITAFFIPWFNEKKFQPYFDRFEVRLKFFQTNPYKYGFRALARLFDPALQLFASISISILILSIEVSWNHSQELCRIIDV